MYKKERSLKHGGRFSSAACFPFVMRGISDCLMKCRGNSNRSRDETDTSVSSEGSSNMGAAIVSSSSIFFFNKVLAAQHWKNTRTQAYLFYKRSFPISEKEKHPHRLGSIPLLAVQYSAQRGNVLIITVRSVVSWKSEFKTWNDVTFKLTVESQRDKTHTSVVTAKNRASG